MKHARYIGPNPDLCGEGALVRDDPYEDDRVLVQFDNLNLPVEYQFLAREWHSFPVDCFEEDQ